tara:strand:+ start:1525 stop:2169 length:645 start_codon:yes stop_codon:yes gene_type:complete
MDDQRTLVERYENTSAALKPTDFWALHDNLIISHDAVMRIAAFEKIHFQPPVVYGDKNAVAILVVGEKTDDGGNVLNCMWSFGEASPDNCKNAYLWAMAEKRAKDRVTLMLIGAYEYGVYSDVEADEFKAGAKDIAPSAPTPDWVTADDSGDKWRDESAFKGGKNAGISWRNLESGTVVWAMENHKSERVKVIAQRELEARELDQTVEVEKHSG